MASGFSGALLLQWDINNRERESERGKKKRDKKRGEEGDRKRKIERGKEI